MVAGYANPADPAAAPGVPPAGTGAGGPGDFDGPFYWNADTTAGFWQYLKQMGLSGTGTDNTPVAKYAQGQQKRIEDQYAAAAGEDANMGFWDYLQKYKPDFATEYQSQSPEQRGDFSSRTYTPRARWTSG